MNTYTAAQLKTKLTSIASAKMTPETCKLSLSMWFTSLW